MQVLTTNLKKFGYFYKSASPNHNENSKRMLFGKMAKFLPTIQV
jgi:hypothetical protein